jgi:RNA polymerase sigma-54 factor
MALGQRLELRQTTQLVMTLQLRQALRLLQMSNLELGAFVQEEVEKNPLLELATGPDAAPDAPGREADEAGTPPEAQADGEAGDPADPVDRRIAATGPDRAAAELDGGRENLYDEAVADGQAGWARVGGPAPGEGADFAETLGEEPALRDHLLAQIGLMAAPAPVRAFAAVIVDELDEAGYLREDLAAVAARHGAGEAAAAAALALVQACDPAGVGARSLAECLALQLRERNRLDPAMQALLDNLPLLAEGRFDRLRALAGVGQEDMADMLAELRALDPRPGEAFRPLRIQTVVPDLLVRRSRHGGLTVELNSDAQPRVLVNAAFAAEVARGGARARAFVSECRAGASWLVKTLEQRARTILKVGTEIVRRQETYFLMGVQGLRPMTLRDVADAVGLHESTVSRVTAGKYLACDRGVLELKFFFSQGLPAAGGGEALSATAIRDRIRRLIDAENPAEVLSDDTIVLALRREGIDVARRTVAKYRVGMHIPSSVQRRRLKSALLPASGGVHPLQPGSLRPD